MDKIIACVVFILMAVGVFLFMLTATPNEPCDETAEDNCSWERTYGAERD